MAHGTRGGKRRFAWKLLLRFGCSRDDEGGLARRRDRLFAFRCGNDLDFVNALLRVVDWNSHFQRLENIGRCGQLVGISIMHRHALQALDLDANLSRLFRGVHQLDLIDVLDQTTGNFARQHAAITHHIHLQGVARGQPADEQPHHDEQQCRVNKNAWSQQMRPLLALAPLVLHGVFAGVANQPARITHLVHDLIAGIDTGAAADAHVLQAIADIDARRADLHADAAVHAIALALRARVDMFAPFAARLAPFGVVGDDERVLVDHHRLKAGIRAHVLADLLAHEPGVAIGGEAVEQNPERLPGA